MTRLVVVDYRTAFYYLFRYDMVATCCNDPSFAIINSTNTGSFGLQLYQSITSLSKFLSNQSRLFPLIVLSS
ncbi:unnamed protein product [Linum trigynum]|uniref:Uncharacterized protein n=1 Tax=Linum trigynum TaxID=586398 RepID=A0AAV2DGX8_9ROSI